MRVKSALIIIFILIFAGVLFAWRQDAPTTAPANVSTLQSQKNLPVMASEITYFKTTQGFLAKPSAPGSYPGVVMIHEWWGLNDNIKEMARQLASEGYIVLAVDLYNGEVAATRERAQELRTALTPEEAVANLRAAVNFLRGENATKIASLGWCFGGGKSLELALSGEKLDATVIYYGQLVTDAQKLQRITWPVLGVFGEKDASISVESVQTFGQEIQKVSKESEIYIYPGVGHAFANPSGASYAPAETKDAWEKTIRFLNSHLQ